MAEQAGVNASIAGRAHNEVDDVYGSGHLPDSISAGALAWRAGQEDSGVTVR